MGIVRVQPRNGKLGLDTGKGQVKADEIILDTQGESWVCKDINDPNSPPQEKKVFVCRPEKKEDRREGEMGV